MGGRDSRCGRHCRGGRLCLPPMGGRGIDQSPSGHAHLRGSDPSVYGNGGNRPLQAGGRPGYADEKTVYGAPGKLHGADHQPWAVLRETAGDETSPGHSRRAYGMCDHAGSASVRRAVHLHKIAGAGVFLADTSGKKWKKIQNLQVQEHVSGRRGAQEGAAGEQPGEQRYDVQTGMGSADHWQRERAGAGDRKFHPEVFHRRIPTVF